MILSCCFLFYELISSINFDFEKVLLERRDKTGKMEEMERLDHRDHQVNRISLQLIRNFNQ